MLISGTNDVTVLFINLWWWMTAQLMLVLIKEFDLRTDLCAAYKSYQRPPSPDTQSSEKWIKHWPLSHMPYTCTNTRARTHTKRTHAHTHTHTHTHTRTQHHNFWLFMWLYYCYIASSLNYYLTFSSEKQIYDDKINVYFHTKKKQVIFFYYYLFFAS